MKVIAVIPARLNSKRLPRKLMMRINDTPVLQHTVESVGRATKISEIWLVTTTNPEDVEIEKFSRRLYDIHCFRGEERNIISRILAVANDRKADAIVVVDGEQPLTDPRLIDKMVEILELGYPSVIFRGIPHGIAPTLGFTREKLKEVFATKNTVTEDNWWKLFDTDESFCVDTEADFQRIKKIMGDGP